MILDFVAMVRYLTKDLYLMPSFTSGMVSLLSHVLQVVDGSPVAGLKLLQRAALSATATTLGHRCLLDRATRSLSGFR